MTEKRVSSLASGVSQYLIDMEQSDATVNTFNEARNHAGNHQLENLDGSVSVLLSISPDLKHSVFAKVTFLNFFQNFSMPLPSKLYDHLDTNEVGPR